MDVNMVSGTLASKSHIPTHTHSHTQKGAAEEKSYENFGMTKQSQSNIRIHFHIFFPQQYLVFNVANFIYSFFYSDSFSLPNSVTLPLCSMFALSLFIYLCIKSFRFGPIKII